MTETWQVRSHFFLVAAVVLLTLGCREQAGESVQTIIRSKLDNQKLLDLFGRRVSELADDKDDFFDELTAAGFQRRDLGSDCGILEKQEPGQVHARVQYCIDDGLFGESVRVMRVGISRDPLGAD